MRDRGRVIHTGHGGAAAAPRHRCFICPVPPVLPDLHPVDTMAFMQREVERIRKAPVGSYYIDGQYLYRKGATGQLEVLAEIPAPDQTSFRWYEDLEQGPTSEVKAS